MRRLQSVFVTPFQLPHCQFSPCFSMSSSPPKGTRTHHSRWILYFILTLFFPIEHLDLLGESMIHSAPCGIPPGLSAPFIEFSKFCFKKKVLPVLGCIV